VSLGGSHQKQNQGVNPVKDRYYDGIEDNGEYEAPWTSYDHDLDFNNDPETWYEPETDYDWAGEYEEPDDADID
jgi:hypothetical protein